MENVKEVPVYLFTGFLEAGKTKFIQETFEDPRFNNGENTLLLVCEEGEDEYDRSRFKGNLGKFITLEIDSPEMLTTEFLSENAHKHDIDRVVVEYNGMWMLDAFYSAMPEGWIVYQEIMFADSSTFLNYNANMRSLVVDKLKSCELVVFNRADSPAFDKMSFHKIVRAVSRRTDIAYEYASSGDVEYDDIEDPPPYDMSAPVIEIKDEDYAFWYSDFSYKPETYDGKTLLLHVMAAKNSKLAKDELVVGRKVMVCCADDVQYKGMLCKCADAPEYKSNEWVMLTARVVFEKHPLYRGQRGPVLYAKSISHAKAPEKEIAE